MDAESCAICLESLGGLDGRSAAQLDPCGHASFCGPCLLALYKHHTGPGSLACPVCRTPATHLRWSAPLVVDLRPTPIRSIPAPAPAPAPRPRAPNPPIHEVNYSTPADQLFTNGTSAIHVPIPPRYYNFYPNSGFVDGQHLISAMTSRLGATPMQHQPVLGDDRPPAVSGTVPLSIRVPRVERSTSLEYTRPQHYQDRQPPDARQVGLLLEMTRTQAHEGCTGTADTHASAPISSSTRTFNPDPYNLPVPPPPPPSNWTEIFRSSWSAYRRSLETTPNNPSPGTDYEPFGARLSAYDVD